MIRLIFSTFLKKKSLRTFRISKKEWFEKICLEGENSIRPDAILKNERSEMQQKLLNIYCKEFE